MNMYLCTILGSSSKTSTEPVQNLQDALNARCHGGRTALHVAADSAQLGPARVLLAAGALETTMGFLRTPPSATIGYALNPQNPVRERALWRLLQQAPAYRFISWLWPAVPIDSGGGFGEGGKTKTLTSESCCLRDNLGNWQIYRKLKLGPKLDVTPIMSRLVTREWKVLPTCIVYCSSFVKQSTFLVSLFGYVVSRSLLYFTDDAVAAEI